MPTHEEIFWEVVHAGLDESLWSEVNKTIETCPYPYEPLGSLELNKSVFMYNWYDQNTKAWKDYWFYVLFPFFNRFESLSLYGTNGLRGGKARYKWEKERRYQRSRNEEAQQYADRFFNRRPWPHATIKKIEQRAKDRYGWYRLHINTPLDFSTNRFYPNVIRAQTYHEAWGPFCPVQDGNPAFIKRCDVCNSSMQILTLDNYKVRRWGEYIDGPLPDDWSTTNINLQDSVCVCENPACQEVHRYMGRQHDHYALAKQKGITPNVPTRKTLQSLPREYRGAFMTARMLDFEARLEQRKDRAKPTE